MHLGEIQIKSIYAFRDRKAFMSNSEPIIWVPFLKSLIRFWESVKADLGFVRWISLLVWPAQRLHTVYSPNLSSLWDLI